MNKSRGDYAYTLMDLDSPVTGETIEKLNKIKGLIRFRGDSNKTSHFQKRKARVFTIPRRSSFTRSRIFPRPLRSVSLSAA